MNIFEIVNQYGPIVHADNGLGIIITANNLGLKWWVQMTPELWEMTDERNESENYKTLPLDIVVDHAIVWANDVIDSQVEEP